MALGSRRGGFKVGGKKEDALLWNISGKGGKGWELGLGVWQQRSPGLIARPLLFLAVIHGATARHDSGCRA